MPTYPTVTVKWADHYYDAEDWDIEELKKEFNKPYYGEYTGKLVFENKQIIVLCSNVWEDGSVSSLMAIMKRAIVNRSDKV